MNISFYIFITLVFFIKALIAIGDLIIHILKLIIRIPKILLLWTRDTLRLFSKVVEKFASILKFSISRTVRNIRIFIINSFRNFNKPHIKLRKDSMHPDKKKKKRKITIFKYSTFWIKTKYFFLGFIFSGIFIFLPILFFIFIQDLPNPNSLSLQDSAQTTKIYDRNGKLLHQIYANQNRTAIPLSEVPKYLQEATIAIEDKDFYSNPGFNIEAIIRATVANLSGKPIQGGSTITQQLIKSELLTPEITLTRKMKEIILAFWAEKIYSKDQILEMYLNEIPYGGTAWGIEVASKTYFGKSAKDLTLSESVFLAGLPNAPTLYSPYGERPDLWKKRQKKVLEKMVDQKYISQEEKLKAENENLVFEPLRTPINAPHFVMYVKQLLVQKYGLAMVERGGLTVKTSLDLSLQETTERIVENQVDSFLYLNLTNGAALITNPKNGDILAMVGSKDYDDSNGGNYNITTALRQPGSSIKAITYTNALLKGFTAATTIIDVPITFKSKDGGPSYSPVNYDSRFRGTLTLRQALGNSVNIPAVKMLNATGISSMVELAKKMGIKTWGDPDRYGLAITLGAAEVKMTDMATVYGTLANQGKRIDLNPILEIKDSKGNMLEEKQAEEQKVIDPAAAFIISDILSDNQARSMAFGTNSPLVIDGHTVSVKTGTSDNIRDNWTIGYTPSYVVTVWVGNNDNSPMNQTLTSGITGAGPIWNEIMTALLLNKSDQKQPIPPNIISKNCLGRKEYFIKGTENFANCIRRSPSISPSP